MSWLDAAAIIVGGFLAGAVNAAAGGGSLISYPLLVALGYPSLSANLTNTVGMIPGYLGGSVAYRAELADQRARLRPICLSSGAGAILGAVLVVSTPSNVFSQIVPWMIGAASLLMAFQPRLVRQLSAARGTHARTSVNAAAFLVGVYGAYFNAGLGVVILAALGLLLREQLQQINGLKAIISLVVSTIAAVLFVFLGNVAWLAAGILATSSYLGGHLGGTIARLIKEAPLRIAIVISGLVLSAVMLT